MTFFGLLDCWWLFFQDLLLYLEPCDHLFVVWQNRRQDTSHNFGHMLVGRYVGNGHSTMAGVVPVIPMKGNYPLLFHQVYMRFF